MTSPAIRCRRRHSTSSTPGPCCAISRSGASLVAKLAASVRPDGWLLLEEADTYGTAGLADGAVAEAWWWTSEMVRACRR